MTYRKPLNRGRIPNARTKLNAIPRICLRAASIVCLGLVIGIVAVSGARAQTEDVYLVADVRVDDTAETAAIAREKAIDTGHRIAFERLMRRLVLAGESASLPEMSRADIDPLVLSFGIDEERRSSVRYIGKLRFKFRRAEVRRFLQELQLSFAETRSKPVLLLPVYENAGAKLLWDDPNPWLAAWKAVPPSDGLVPLRLPVGDLADVRDISAEQAASGNTEQLALIAERYGASAVLVAQAAIEVDTATGNPSISVTTRYFGGVSSDRTGIRSVAVGEEETHEAALSRAAREVSVQIEEDWKGVNQLQFDRLNDLVADVSVDGLREWVEIRQRLRRVAFLQNTRLVSVSRRKATVRLTYYGDPEQLQVALAQRDLVLEQGDVNWILRDSREIPVVPAGPETDEGNRQ